MKPIVQKTLTHAGILLIFFILACIFFSPVLSGKVIMQGDIQKYEAMAAEQKRVQEATGEVPAWNSAMFSGMPGYQVTAKPQKSIFSALKSVLTMHHIGWERNIGVLFLYLIGFYVAMISLGCSPWLAVIGAIALGLGSYNIIIVEAGHITKAWAISMMAPILASMVMIFQGTHERTEAIEKTPIWKNGKIVWGFILFTIALGLQIAFNHIQITFYTVIGGIILGATYLVYSIKEKYFSEFAAGVGVLLLACVLAFGGNIRHLLVNQEYAKYTMRGGTELTINPDGKEEVKSEGLEIDYAFAWSYGIGETYTILVPGAYGGGSREKVSKDSQSYKTFRQSQMPLYWGEQPFTSGPVYFGAIICFLFVLGLFVVKGPERWWLLIATLLAVVMSWGKNFLPLNDLLFKYLPLYNKFRTPSMSLVLANITMIMLGILGVRELFTSDDKKRNNRAIYCATGITIGILLVMLIVKNNLSFSGASDRQMAAQYGQNWGQIFSVLVSDRKALFVSDTWRSILFILPVAIVIWLSANKILKKDWIAYSVIAVSVLADLWAVDRRYLDDDNYINPKKVALKPSATDLELDRLAAQFGDKDYRVFDLSVNTFNDSQPSAFHHQVGGYSAAKLRRYQDLIDFHLSRPINPEVLNMLNTRYVVQRDGVHRNPEALGNAWFVREVQAVRSADEEILALKDFDPAKTAIVDVSKWQIGQFEYDENATISMQHEKMYNPDHLTYHSNAATDQLAVFSEIHYAPDWFAYIDGKPAEYVRANYVLRAMIVPAGEHTIEFVNEAPRFHLLDRWTLICSIILSLILAGVLVLCYMPSRKTAASD